MTLDAIIISDSGVDTVSGTNPLRLNLDGRTADIQVVLNYLKHQGQITMPIEGDGILSWASAPKLNGIYLLSYLTKHHFNVELINSFYDEKDQFSRLLEGNPHAVIISTTFMVGKQSLIKLINEIRNLAPDISIIVGGTSIYMSYLMLQRSLEPKYDTESAKDDFLFLNVDNEPSVDLYIISLRGEQILRVALNKIRNAQPLDELPNSARFDGNTYHFSRQVDDITGAEDFSVDWTSLPDAIFNSGVVPIQASIGCPYDCAFCNFTKDRRLSHIKPVDQLVDEMKTISSRGARYVWFVDDNFRLGRGDLNTVCQRFIDEGVNINWMTFIRASTLKDIDVELLRLSGCSEVQLGLESADPEMLQNMNKKSSPQLYDRVLKNLLSSGINCSCYFIFGFPGETDDTLRRTQEFIKNHEYPEYEGNLSWSIFPFILTPLSPIYEPQMRKKYGLTGYLTEWQHNTMNSNQAKAHIIKTFFELEHSGPIYRGDNQEIFRRIGAIRRKKFEAIRHSLSKAAVSGQLNKQDILKSFKLLLSI